MGRVSVCRVIEDLKSNDHAYQGKLLVGRGEDEFCMSASMYSVMYVSDGI